VARLSFGPGAMVAAAFIGPGTVTTATASGAGFGVSLLWAVAFSVLATLVLQELAMRSALVTQRDLSHLMRGLGAGRWWGGVLVALIVLAIGVGNSAYQSGNLAGASLGLEAAFGGTTTLWVLVAAVIAGILIGLDRYVLLERALVGLVSLMALLFVGLALLLLPDILALPSERWQPSLPDGGQTMVLALIGTTVVPYNLFLHATAARKRWADQDTATALKDARLESAISILIGGLVTAAIVLVASVLLTPADGEAAIARLIAAVEVTLPGWGAIAVGTGLFAAGLTSAIAAPVSAGWAVCGAMGWSVDHQSGRFRGVAFLVLLTGVLFAAFTTRPVALIVLAQAANALLLPIVALALVVVANQTAVLGTYRNSWFSNTLAILVLVIVLGLAGHRLLGLF
jgi:manganese transport protein